MSSPLSGIPAERRKRLAATLGLFSVLFLAVGAVAATGGTSTVLVVSVTVAMSIALLLALIGWGVLRSIRLDTRADTTDRRIDAAIEDAISAQGSTLRDLTCGCGHDHDPTELHVTDDPCDRDGGIVGCSQTCETCVFARLGKPAPMEGARPAATRPSPAPRRPMPSRTS